MFRSRLARLLATVAAGFLIAASAEVITAAPAAAACGPGAILGTNGSCYSVPQGSYMPNVDYTYAFTCPLPYSTAGSGATASAACNVTSPAGKYATTELYDGGGLFTPFNRVVHNPCAPGSYQPNSGATSCFPAPAGYYIPVSGATSVSQAIACPSGQYSFGGAASCTQASPGYRTNASSAATGQVPCTAGTTSPGNQSFCNPSPAGYYAPNSGMASPLPCSAGTYMPSSGATACTPASVNFYVPSGASTAQTPCPAGTHQPATGSTACIPQTVPGPPTVTSSTPSLTAVSVTFTPGSNGGSAITGYTAECVSTDGGATGTGTGLGSPISATGLSTGKLYHCRVKATNGVGDSAYSVFGSTVLTATAPGAPTVTDSTPSTTGVSVGFTPGAANGSPVTGYTAECVSSNGGATGTATGSASPISVTGLSTGKLYQCRVKATNGVGDGSYGGFGSSVLTATVPDAPTVTGSTPALTSVSVSFSPGAANGSDVTGFTAECVSTDGGTTGTASGSASPISVTGLTTGKNYHCRVKATNGVGDSPYGGFGSTVLTAAAPGAPTVTGSTAAPLSVTVSFSPGADNGSPVTAYTAECVSTDGGTPGSDGGAGSPITVDGLTPGKGYHCRVKATNGVGDSPFSGFGADVLVPQAPGAPTVVGTLPAPGQISVTFTPGDTGGSPVTAYTAECASTDGGATRTATGAAGPLTVTGLTAAKHYRCRVKAANAAGESPYGALAPEVLVPGVPGKPVVKKSRAKSPTKLTLKLDLADSGGSPVSGFEVSCKSSNGGKAKTVTSARPSLAVTKLTPGKTYRCKARASNAVGLGPWSSKGPKTVLPAARLSASPMRGPGRLGAL